MGIEASSWRWGDKYDKVEMISDLFVFSFGLSVVLRTMLFPFLESLKGGGLKLLNRVFMMFSVKFNFYDYNCIIIIIVTITMVPLS